MTRRSILALLTMAVLAVGAALLLRVTSPSAQAQQVGFCPATMPSGATQLTCQCAGSDGSSAVWGTEYYTDDSNLCNAAVHAGAMPATGGVITVNAAAGRSSYNGTSRNGISTRDYGQWGRSIIFNGAGAYSSAALCPSTYNAQGTGWSGTCRCDGVGTGSVWGSNIYTADSDLCRAARHAGVIGVQGGTVRVTAAPGQSSYAGSTRNGITTSRWGSYGASFRVSR